MDRTGAVRGPGPARGHRLRLVRSLSVASAGPGRGAVESTLLPELLGRCRFPPPGSAVACAVSGGADSLALLVLSSAAGLRVTAIHVDHGLRAGSAAEASVVEEAAAAVGAGFERRAVTVAPGPNLEARARAARYGALPPGVLTGHTADDLAETMLVNLLRGAGLDGLSPMRDQPAWVARLDGLSPMRDDPDIPSAFAGNSPEATLARVVRPFLGLRRAETRSLCQAQGLTPVEDPSNTDPRFVRNRVRHEVLPLLAAISGRDPVPVLVRQARLLGDEADYLDRQAAPLDPTDARAVAAAEPVLARRAVRRWLQHSSPECHPPSAAEVERVLEVARGEARACQLSADRRVLRSRGRLVVTSN